MNKPTSEQAALLDMGHRVRDMQARCDAMEARVDVLMLLVADKLKAQPEATPETIPFPVKQAKK